MGFRSGFVSIVGSTNVGKSTLMNAMIGQKVAIVSHKAQTTRNRIRGIMNGEGYQVIFIDTPGIHTPRTRLGEYMIQSAFEALREIECVLFVIDPIMGIRERDENMIKRLRNAKCPVIAIINKIDAAPKEKIQACEDRLASEDFFDGVLKISATAGDGLQELKEIIKRYLTEGPQYFPDDMITDQPERVICAEFIREAALNCLEEEIPHGIGVDIDKINIREDKELIDIWATIYCEKDSHKGMIIGKHGAMLKKIGSLSRPSIEWMLDKKVNLQLWVKVRELWRNKVGDLKMLGYNNSDN